MRCCLVVGALVAVLGGCRGSSNDLAGGAAVCGTTPATWHRRVLEKTERRFAQAVFAAPAPEAEADPELPIWMAPLLMEEVRADAEEQTGQVGVGTVAENRREKQVTGTGPKTVYYRKGSAWFQGREFCQWTFLWGYPPSEAGRMVRYRGVRIILGADNFAILWEVLSSDLKGRIFYVAEPVEVAAALHFGPALRGRVFCVEPSVAEQPTVVVARALGRGPQPMGPFVYLEEGSLEITTLLCRCMPSQVDAEVRKDFYELVRVRSGVALREKLGLELAVNLPEPSVRLDGVLRLPPGL